MANLKVKLEGKKIAEKVMEFIDMKSFEPIYEEIEKKRRLPRVYQRDNEMYSYKKNNRRFGRTWRTSRGIQRICGYERSSSHKGYGKDNDKQGKARTCIGTFQNTIPGKPGRIRGSDSESSKRTILQITNNI